MNTALLAVLQTSVWVALAWRETATSAIITRDDVDDAQYVALGARAEYASTARIVVDNAGGGSGVLLAPTWVITAGHVVMKQQAAQLHVTVGGRTHAVRRAIVHPAFITAPMGLARSAHDVALLELDVASCVTPMPRATQPVTPGTRVTLVGYGVGGPGARDTAGARRGAQNRVDQVGGMLRSTELPPNALLLDFDDGMSGSRNALGSADPEPLEGLASGGDSGGGLFVQEGGMWRVLGTFSVSMVDIGGASRRAFGGSLNLFVGVDGHRDWITETIGSQSGSRSGGQSQARPAGCGT